MTPLIDRRAWLFGAKTFAAAMLALYVSFVLALPAPYWAMATCYVVAQPWSGMARAKGLYRLLGTLAGATAAVVMLPNLAASPELLAAAMCLWVAGCLAASLLLRAPESYAFLLAGYTAAIVGFPLVDHPETVFAIAISRVTEIGTGIISVLLLDSLFPSHSSPHVVRQLDDMLAGHARLVHDTVAGDAAWATLDAEATQVAQANISMAGLLAHVRYEPPAGTGVRDWAPIMHQHLRAVPLLLASIKDRVGALQEQDSRNAEALHPLLSRIAHWVASGLQDPPSAMSEAALLRARLHAAMRQESGINSWAALLHQGLLQRLLALVESWHATIAARHRIGTTARPAPSEAVTWPPVHADPALVLQSSLGVLIALACICVFWIGTGWPDGAGAASIAAISASLFAQHDNAGHAAGRFFIGTALAVAGAAIYQFVLLPPITTGFVPLAAALALLFLPAGAALAVPSLAALALPITLMGSVILGINAHFEPGFASFANGATASLAGAAASMVGVALARPAGAAWRIQRLIRLDRADIARAARPELPIRPDLMELLTDRFDEVMARLPPGSTAGSLHGSAMQGLRLALNIAELRHALPTSPPTLATQLAELLNAVASLMNAPGNRPNSEDTMQHLRISLDAALAAALSQRQRTTALALAGLRRALLPHSPPPALAPRETMRNLAA